jgi:hypothetical protein
MHRSSSPPMNVRLHSSGHLINNSFFKHALTQFVVLCKYLPHEESTVNMNFPCTLRYAQTTSLSSHFEPNYGKGHTSNIHQAPTGPDLAIITPLFTLIPLESPLMTILASSHSACTRYTRTYKNSVTKSSEGIRGLFIKPRPAPVA